MWKKMGVIFLSFMATVSVVYAMNKELFADANRGVYQAGGSINGRIHMAPDGLSGSNIGLQKGDKVFAGLSGDKLDYSFQLIKNIQDVNALASGYNLTQRTIAEGGSEWSNSNVPNYIIQAGSNEKAWITMATTPYVMKAMCTEPININRLVYQNGQLGVFGEDMDFHSDILNLTNELTNSSIHSLIRNVDLSHLAAMRNTSANGNANGLTMKQVGIELMTYHGKSAYLFNGYSNLGESGSVSLPVTSIYAYHIEKKDLAFSSDYWQGGSIGGRGSTFTQTGDYNEAGATGAMRNYSEILAVRPALNLNFDDVVFAVSMGTNSGIGTVTEPKLDTGYSSLYDETLDDKNMKLRIVDTSLQVTLNELQNMDGTTLVNEDGNSSFYKGEKIKVNATASPMNSNTISALVFDEDNKFKFYQPLGIANGMQSYELDTSSFSVGEYKIALVNEVYDDASTQPAKSSLISNVIAVSVKPETMQKLQYTSTPQNQDTYEYNVNVKEGSKIAEFNRRGGVAPIKYQIVTNGDDTYQNFEISGLDASGKSSATTLDINVKANGAPDIVSNTGSLMAGTYKFCIESTDSKNNPPTQILDESKICVSLTVDKTKPSLFFLEENTKDIEIGNDLSTEINLVNSSFGNLTSSNISYTLMEGVANVLNVYPNAMNPLQYDLRLASSLNENVLPVTFKLKAKISESENYLASDEISREIFVYKELSSLKWTADKVSYAPSDCTSGEVVGTLLAEHGVGPFTYALDNSSDSNDNSSFHVPSTSTAAGTAVNVTTSTSLTAGTYTIDFKVTDSKNVTVRKSAQIIVQANTQTGFEWKDSVGGATITSTEFEFGTLNNKIIAEGGQSASAVVYELAPQDKQPSGVSDANAYVNVNPNSGLLTLKKVGTVKVMATRPGNATYSESKIYMDLKIIQGKQSIVFNTGTVDKVKIDNYATIDAKGTLTRNGSAGIGTITYSSSDTAKTYAEVDPTNGKVTGISEGVITLTATLNKEGTSGYNSDYETKSVTRDVTIYKGMEFGWTNGTLKANANAIGDRIGDITVSDSAGSNPLTATLSTSTGSENKDKEYFQDTPVVNGNIITLKLKKQIDAAAHLSHQGGTFKVQVIITDANGSQPYNVIALVDEADNKVSFTNSDGDVISELTKVYADDNNKFKLTSKSASSGNVIYSAVNPTQDILDIKANGDVEIQKQGTTRVKVYVGSGNGYGEAEKEMDVIVNPAVQSIVFNDTTNPLKLEVGNTKTQTATGNVILSNTTKQSGVGTITYHSTNPAVASVDENGIVTAVTEGPEVTITATINATTNTDHNANYKDASISKKVQVFKGKSIEVSSVTPHAKAGSIIKDMIVANVETKNSSGPITYEIVSGLDGEKFKIINNGNKAEIRFNDGVSISANELFLHGNDYKLKITVKDDNGITTSDEITIVVDNADNPIEFKKAGNTITKISEVYGTNSNTFTVIAVPSSGGSVTYEVIGDNSVMDVDAITGEATIKKAGTTTIQATTAAGKGYAENIETIEAEITQGDQWITFDDDIVEQAFKAGETFSAKATLHEVTNINVSTRLINYTALPSNVCTIDGNGTVSMLATGECTITAENKETNWKVQRQQKVVTIYDGMIASYTPSSTIPQAGTPSGGATKLVGTVRAQGGIGNKTFAKSESTEAFNKDAKYFTVNEYTGDMTLTNALTAMDLVDKYSESEKAYILCVEVLAKDSAGNIATKKLNIKVIGAPLSNVSIINDGSGIIEKSFDEGSFSLSLANNTGGGQATYTLREDLSRVTEIIEVNAGGNVIIKNANRDDEPAVFVDATILPNKGYEGKTVSCEIFINKAEQKDFKFTQSLVKLQKGSSFDLTVEGILAKDSEGNPKEWSMISDDEAMVSVSNHTVKAELIEGKVKITASVGGDFNYKAASAEMEINVTSEAAYAFEIKVPVVTYGDVFTDDTPFIPEIFIDEGKGTKTRTWSSSDENIATIDATTGAITIHHAGRVQIKCIQSIVGQADVSSEKTLTVKQKEVNVSVDNQEKYVGEEVPTFHVTIAEGSVLVGDSLSTPHFTCFDGSQNVTADTKVGEYPINVQYDASENKDYLIKVNKTGILTVKQDSSLASWFHLEGATSKQTVDGSKWYNEDINVVLNEAVASAGSYDELSLDKALWGTNQTIDKDGVNTQEISFRINTTKTLSTSQPTTVKIDKGKPVVTSITGTPAKRNAIEELLNSLTFGKYFKPKLEVSIKAEDKLPEGVLENSKLKTIHYNVYQIKEDNTLSDVIASGEMKPTDTMKLIDEGDYFVCALAEDNAGNMSTENCSGLRIKEIGDDSDDDGIPDLNIDTDGDGKPNLNITKNPDDKKPWTNIDTNGDGEPDMNIDIDGDGTPDLQTGIVMNYKPNKEVDLDEDGIIDYKTDGTLFGINNHDSDGDQHPDINIDLNLDGEPELNIDTDQEFSKPETDIDGDGDGKKDINLDNNEDGTPEVNVVTISIWKPELNVESNQNVLYDTMRIEYKAKDTLEDNGVIVKPSDPEHIFLPNYALQVNDVTKDMDEETKKSIIEITGGDGEVKRVFDISLSDGEKTIQPDGSIVVRIPVDETIKNPRILLRNEAGKFEEVKMSVEDGYYVFETTYLGQISIVGDIEENEDTSGDINDTIKDKETPVTPNFPNSSVKGSYTAGIGGAGTGDETNVVFLLVLLILSMLILKGMQKQKQDR